MLMLALGGCSTSGSNQIPADDSSIGNIYRSDGDSGRLDGAPFRLKDVDAPEAGGVGAAFGGAKCEKERELGYLAKEFMVTITANATLTITHNYGPDRYDRNVVDLNAGGIDVAAAGVESGLLNPWPHDRNGISFSAKPNWCE